jgi:hypothetical protein
MHLTGKDMLKIKGWKNIFQANEAPKHVGVATFISNKADFKPKLVRRD